MSDGIATTLGRQGTRAMKTVVPGILGVAASTLAWPGFKWASVTDATTLLGAGTFILVLGSLMGTLVFLLHRNLVHHSMNTRVKKWIRAARASRTSCAAWWLATLARSTRDELDIKNNLKKYELRWPDDGGAFREIGSWSGDIHAKYGIGIVSFLVWLGLLCVPELRGGNQVWFWLLLAFSVIFYFAALHTDIRQTFHEILLEECYETEVKRRKTA